jgi:hypothetical protein
VKKPSYASVLFTLPRGPPLSQGHSNTVANLAAAVLAEVNHQPKKGYHRPGGSYLKKSTRGGKRK